MTKLFQYDKKVWDYGDTDRTWQFGIFKNRSLLWMNYQTSSKKVDTFGGFHIQLSFFASSLFGITLGTNKTSLSFYFCTEYFPGWD
jgi:hypothetical protein